MKWRHVGGGSTEKIMKRYTWSDIDEDELLGLGMYPGLIYATARRQPCFVLICPLIPMFSVLNF